MNGLVAIISGRVYWHAEEHEEWLRAALETTLRACCCRGGPRKGDRCGVRISPPSSSGSSSAWTTHMCLVKH